MHTEHERFPELVVPVAALVGRPDSGLVKSLMIANLAPGESREVSLLESGADSGALRVLSASYQGDSGLRMELCGQPSPSDGPRVRLTRPAEGTAVAVARGTVALRVENVEEEVQIPITVLCSGAR